MWSFCFCKNTVVCLWDVPGAYCKHNDIGNKRIHLNCLEHKSKVSLLARKQDLCLLYIIFHCRTMYFFPLNVSLFWWPPSFPINTYIHRTSYNSFQLRRVKADLLLLRFLKNVKPTNHFFFKLQLMLHHRQCNTLLKKESTIWLPPHAFNSILII